MADSSVSLTPGTGVQVDTRTQPNGDHREVVVLGDPTNTNVAAVGATGGLSVKGAAYASTVVPFTTSGMLSNPIDVSEAGNVTFYVRGTYTGTSTLVFTCSDNGTDWSPLMVQRVDTGLVASQHLVPAQSSGTAIALNAALPGVNFVRILSSGGPATGTLNVAVIAGGMPFQPTVGMQPPLRSHCTFYTAAPAAGLAAETLLSLTSTRAGATVAATTTPAVVSAGKTLRITGFSATYIATGATGYGMVRLRANLAGVATATSPLYRQIAAGAPTPATANSSGSASSSVPVDGVEFPAGAGIGVTVQAYNGSIGAAVGLVLVEVVGYEY